VIVERVTIPAPIVVKPSETFDGIDGLFSSFNISVGTPPQTLKVFIGTSVYRTLVVWEKACRGEPENCSDLRGGVFSNKSSSTWQQNIALPSSNNYFMQIDQQLGYNNRAAFGFDNVGLGGPGGISLKNQTVGVFVTDIDAYLGLFGLDPRPSNFSGDPTHIPSYMQSLRNQSLIPSLSWGYSAGNQYRSSNSFGTLTLGGYDKSRFVQHDGSWPLNDVNDLAVLVQKITWNNGQGLLPNTITAVLDSALPYIWLPKEACLLFENAFGLQWNNSTKLYLVDDTLHRTLLEQNASITFTLGGMTEGSTANVDITLPYAAFDLTGPDPLNPNATRYFPLKRAADPTQFVIGRTFFQEAFVVADYERRNFSVYPSRWEADAKPEIVTIFSPSYGITPVPGPGNSTDDSTSKSSKGKSNAGPIAGGVVGGLLFIAAVAAAVFYFCYWRSKRRQHYTTNGEKSEMLAPLPDNPALALEDPHMTKAELANTQRMSNIPELEGSGGGPSHVFEMPVREEVALEMRAPESVHEMASPDTMSEVTAAEGGGFPWRTSLTDRGAHSPSPLGSPGLQSISSPVSSPSLRFPSPIPSPSMIPSTVPSPVPSPPPVAQPQPQRFIRPNLNTIDSSL